MIITQKVQEFIRTGLVKVGAGDLDYDAFLGVANTPFGQQPVVTLLVQMKNPLLGQPPLTVANVVLLAEIDESGTHDAVAQMVEHLNKQKTELMRPQQ